MAVLTYSSKKVSVIVAGIIVTGLADGTFVMAERETDSFTKVVGADGEIARSASANRSGTITITLMQTSTSNDLLSALYIADEATLSSKFPVIITDNNGTTKVFSDTCWIQKPANVEFGVDAAGTREWVIQCASMNLFVGSNDA